MNPVIWTVIGTGVFNLAVFAFYYGRLSQRVVDNSASILKLEEKTDQLEPRMTRAETKLGINGSSHWNH